MWGEKKKVQGNESECRANNSTDPKKILEKFKKKPSQKKKQTNQKPNTNPISWPKI